MSDHSGSPNRRRVVLCLGQFCNQQGEAGPLFERLREGLGEPVAPFMASGPVTWEVANCLSMCGGGRTRAAVHASGPVTWEVANCLSMCGGGPNLVIYEAGDPDGRWFHQLDLPALEAIIAAHIRADPAEQAAGSS